MKTSFISLFLLFACAFQASAEPGASLVVATFNVNCGNLHLDQIRDMIKASKADVVFLQETTIESERYLKSELKSLYPNFCSTGYERRFAEDRLAFLSKLPLREIVFSPPSGGYFGCYSANCEVGKTTVKLINVHLAPFVIPPQPGILGLLKAMNDAEGRHAVEIESISRMLDGGQPTIVAGDFNSLSTSVAPSRLRKIGLIDSFAATHPDADNHPTWQGPVAAMNLQLRLDYIFQSSHFRCDRSEIVKQGGSDHFLVTSEFKILEPAGAISGSPPIHGETNQTSSANGLDR